MGAVPSTAPSRLHGGAQTFFRLSAYAEALLERYAGPTAVRAAADAPEQGRLALEGGLQDVSITRESVNWGVPLPWDPDQAIYVWIDALINYTSALTYARPGEDLTTRLWPARWQPRQGHPAVPRGDLAGDAALAGYDACRSSLLIHGMLAGARPRCRSRSATRWIPCR